MEITKASKNFKELYIACKFLPKDDTRYAIKSLNVTKDEIQSTDGRRAIRVKNLQEIAPGRYKVASCTKSLIAIYPEDHEGNYPPFDDIFPKIDLDSDSNGSTLFYSDVLASISTLIYKIAQYKICLNGNFIKPIFDVQADFEFFIQDEGSRPVYFRNDKAEIIIMPINP